MEILNTILVIGTLYVFIHAIIIIIKRIQVKGYEKVVLIAAFILIILNVLGTIGEAVN